MTQKQIEHWKLICRTVFVAENAAQSQLQELIKDKDKIPVEEFADRYTEIIAKEILSKGLKKSQK